MPKKVIHAARRKRPQDKIKKKYRIFRLPLGLSQELFDIVEPLAFEILELKRRVKEVQEKTNRLRERLRRGNQKRFHRWHRKQESHGLAIVRYPQPGQLCPFRCGPKRWKKSKCTEKFRRVRHYRLRVMPQFPTCDACGRSLEDEGLEEVEEDSYCSEDSEIERVKEALERKMMKRITRKNLLDENHFDSFLDLEW